MVRPEDVSTADHVDPILQEAVQIARGACRTAVAMVTDFDGAWQHHIAADGTADAGSPRKAALYQV